MSRYSGKCDFCDNLYVNAETEEEAFEKFKGTKLYISQPLPDDFNWEKALKEKINIADTYYKKVEYSSIKDLIPFYPYLVTFGWYDNADSHNSVIWLSRESFVDREERECLEWRLKELIKIYNRCKRKKIEFDVEEALEKIVWNGYNEEPYRELANRVKEKGKKATIDGIHLKMQEYYRQELVDEMIKHGLNPADYGYGRFIKETNINEDIKE